MQERVKGGRNTYGEVIGILMQERIFPRIPGDMGNASTFNFPVKLYIVKGVDITTRWKLFEGDRDVLKPFVQGAMELERAGVKAITSNCGFLVQCQNEIANAVDIPVFMSSLLMIPLVYRMLRKDRIVGVITANATEKGLGKKHFEAAGAGNIPVAVVGLEDSEAFDTIAKDRDVLHPERLKQDVVERAERLVRENPKVGAIVLECANLPPYAKAIQEAINLPVFDFVTMTNFVFSAVVRQEFRGYI
jgi:Asp/Glu/hydantoin racemase